MEQRLLACLLSNWGLMSELQQLRNLYLLIAPPAQAWAHSLLDEILDGRPLSEMYEYKLELQLQECVTDSQSHYGSDVNTQLPSADKLVVCLNHGRLEDLRMKGVSATSFNSSQAGGFPATLHIHACVCVLLRATPPRGWSSTICRCIHG